MSVLCVCTHTRTHYTWMKGDQQVLTARLMRMDDEDSSVKLYLLQAIDSTVIHTLLPKSQTHLLP